jgi:non-canonical poly(A) RNA polymerase PAPD5/7
MFGSSANRLALGSSDIDMLVYDPKISLNELFRKTFLTLVSHDMFEYVQQITTSRVPIIKLLHKETDINFDISFNNEDALRGLAVVMKIQEAYPELRPLFFVIKAFLKDRGLHEPFTGGIGSFTLVNMIVYYLQSQYKLKHTDLFL